MTRPETLAAIAALPVSDQVKAHATRLIEGLPGDLMPEYVRLPHTTQRFEMEWKLSPHPDHHFSVEIYHETESKTVCTFEECGLRHRIPAGHIFTDHDVHELLRQITGMVALTGGG
jgi:hypothetical protein